VLNYEIENECIVEMQSFVLSVCKSRKMLNDSDDRHWHAFGPAREVSKPISHLDDLHATRKHVGAAERGSLL
jgi:hypothetical protein